MHLVLALAIAAQLHHPVEILRDKWGVPHIYAKDTHDLFFAQGYIQATDRLYQMEVWKRAGQGRLAETFGPAFVQRDIAARTLKYRGPMADEFASYAPDAREILTAFTDGINAYIDAHRNDLPPEFRAAGFAPDRWRPEDCLQRLAAYSLMGNAESELRNAQLLTLLGAGRAAAVIDPQPAVALDPSSDIDYKLFHPEMLRSYVGTDLRIEVPEGSNNWVVSGKRTATGRPLLANDPHRTITVPSLRYIVHLVAPGWNVIGAVEPALPGVAIGHNEWIAWGITVFPIDQEDLIVDAPVVSTVKEVIHVRGGDDVVANIQLTNYGPVIAPHLALRWVGAEPGSAGYMAAISLDRAKNWNGFLEALKRWKAPSENFVYADRDGNIGEQSAALVPVRDWTGLLPVDARHDWRGWIPLAELPRSFNPDRGFIGTANHFIISPADRRHLGYAWASPYRIDRVNEVLAQKPHTTIDDMKALQNDITSLAAREATAMLPDAFKNWDGVISADSHTATLYERWMRYLRSDYIRDNFPEGAQSIVEHALSTPSLLRAVSHDLAQRAFEEASKEPPAKWGTLHLVRFRHPLDKRMSSTDLGPVERPGDNDTVDVTAMRSPSFEQAHGASFREIIDLGDWDRSLAINVPGESGIPGNAHYSDLLPLWSRGEYFPLLFSRRAIEAATTERLEIHPH